MAWRAAKNQRRCLSLLNFRRLNCALAVRPSEISFGTVSRFIAKSAFALPFALKSTICCASAKRAWSG